MARVFQNLDPTTRPQFSKVFQWSVVDRVAGRRRKSPAHSPVEVVDTPQIDAIDRTAAVWLGHATLYITLGGVRILTDPVFAERIAVVVKRNVPNLIEPAQLPGVDVVLISHNHRDHLHRASIQAVDAAHQPHYVAGLGVDRYLKAWGVPASRITTLDWWDTATPIPSRSDLRVHFVPAQHWSQRYAFDRNRSLWGGFVMEADDQRIYFAGDSGYFDGFLEIGRRFPDIQLAAIPIGAYDPEWFMQPQHMNPEQAGQTLLDLGAQRMLSIHWGTYKLTDEPLDEPPSRLEDWRAKTRVDAERLNTLPVGGHILL